MSRTKGVNEMGNLFIGILDLAMCRSVRAFVLRPFSARAHTHTHHINNGWEILRAYPRKNLD